MRLKIITKGINLSLVFSFLTVVAVSVQGQVDTAELKKLQGTWKMVSAEVDGKKVKDDLVKQAMITYSGDKVILFTPHQHKDTIYARITKLDSSKEPGEMQWVRSDGPNAGKTMISIYKFDGPDQCHVCFDPAMTTVPKKFGTDPGSGLIWHTWKRVKN
jgi:uncharacterized protein (TIGR03067 family)